MAKNSLWIISYDVTNNRDRSKLAAHLEEYAIRVQGSVFELRSSKALADKIFLNACSMISPNENLRMYRVPPPMLKDCRNYGLGMEIEEESFILL